jgi:hypothetical protein
MHFYLSKILRHISNPDLLGQIHIRTLGRDRIRIRNLVFTNTHVLHVFYDKFKISFVPVWKWWRT